MNLVLIYFLIKSLNPKAHVSCLPPDLSVTWRWVSTASEAECKSLKPYNIHGWLSFPVNKADHSSKLKEGI